MTERMSAAAARSLLASPKRSKYRNKPIVVDGVRFDSRREFARYGELRALQAAGKIWGLKRQPSFELAPAVRFEGEKRAKPALRYIADFSYWLISARQVLGAHIVEDVKSAPTMKKEAFRIKRHLLKSVHGIDVRIVK